ncbi:hypothetical protein [Streptomyces sp. NPDC051211]|uniref:hypothetical protein n=1 Tax=Streptomyces sp. NPDC051211 TaxID=3154643 RepID=UPI00344C51E4
MRLDEAGEPVHGPRDHPDLAKMAALGLPFWLAGGQASPEAVAAARAEGAAGRQVGSAFALCEESGMAAHLREELRGRAHADTLTVRNDPYASPTSFPMLRLSPDAEPYAAADVVADVVEWPAAGTGSAG